MFSRVLVPALSLLLAAACAQPNATVTVALVADVASAPADGITTVLLTATVGGAPGAIVAFEVAGPAMLGATHVVAADGTATVALYAPTEDQLGAAPASDSTVTASVTVNGVLVSAEAVVSFTLPTTGAPTLLVRAEPDRVLAGGADPIRVIVDGRRLASPSVALSATGAVDGLPSTLALDDLGGGQFHAELVIPAAPTAGSVTLTLRGEGAAPVAVELVFFAEGEAAFNLGGTFAEVSYGTVEIGNLVFLNPNPQCVVAPTFSLVTIEQVDNGDGTAQLTLHSQTCDVQMGDVNVHVLGRSTTRVEQGFVDAANAAGGAPVSFTLTDVGSGASFDVPADALDEPLIVGVDMGSDREGELPTNPEDDRVIDADFDGQPGVTIINSTQGDQHVVYRTRLHAMRGTIDGSNGITGEVEAETETKIFGDSLMSPSITAKPSPWFLRRVDGAYGAPHIASRDGDASSISCADLDAYAAELQADAPAATDASACQ